MFLCSRVFFFFYHSLCRPTGVDSQAPILNSGDAKCRWNDCTRRDAFYFAWISSSSRREQSTSRSRVIVCYRHLQVSSKFLRRPLSIRARNMSRAPGTHRRLYDVLLMSCVCHPICREEKQEGHFFATSRCLSFANVTYSAFTLMNLLIGSLS